MNDVRFPVARVLDGIDAAARAGLSPVKVNMVVKRGVNDHAIIAMAEHFRNGVHILRLIEYMDVGTTNGWRLDDVLPAADILQAIDVNWPLEPLHANYPGEVASRYRYRDGAGEIGVIASTSAANAGLGPDRSGCSPGRFAQQDAGEAAAAEVHPGDNNPDRCKRPGFSVA